MLKGIIQALRTSGCTTLQARKKKNVYLGGRAPATGDDRGRGIDILDGLETTVLEVGVGLDREVGDPAEVIVETRQGIVNDLVDLAQRGGEGILGLIRGREVEAVLGLELEITVDRVRDRCSCVYVTKTKFCKSFLFQ